MTFADWLKLKGACVAGYTAHHHQTEQEFWDTCERGDWMLWVAERKYGEVGWPDHIAFVRIAAACARMALVGDCALLDRSLFGGRRKGFKRLGGIAVAVLVFYGTVVELFAGGVVINAEVKGIHHSPPIVIDDSSKDVGVTRTPEYVSVEPSGLIGWCYPESKTTSRKDVPENLPDHISVLVDGCYRERITLPKVSTPSNSYVLGHRSPLIFEHYHVLGKIGSGGIDKNGILVEVRPVTIDNRQGVKLVQGNLLLPKVRLPLQDFPLTNENTGLNDGGHENKQFEAGFHFNPYVSFIVAVLIFAFGFYLLRFEISLWGIPIFFVGAILVFIAALRII